MSCDDRLAERIRSALVGTADVRERRMFGGLALLVRGPMCCGVLGANLEVRVGPERCAAALKESHVREMDFTGRALKGLVYVEARGSVRIRVCANG
jgi:TfoX/Sxy family transcriptional regulator of competence genes